MKKTPTPSLEERLPRIREWSEGEELANSISHAAGFFGALVGAPFLLSAAAHHGGLRAMIGMVVFAVTTALLYFSSAAHHWMKPGRAKDVFEVIDHAAIFLMIAGTYTPFCLGVLWGRWGWTLLGLVWPLAVGGVLLKALRGLQPKRFTIPLYVFMGWLIFLAFPTLSTHMPRSGLVLICAGGLAYTGGLVFYLARRIPYHHLAWHLAVLIGTAFHYVAVLRYAL